MAPPKADADKDCMGYAFCPDEETDAKKAMASPNSMMTVSSSHDAVITPLWMDSEPNGIGVSAADDNMPFKNVDWNAMQSTVANMGVSFKAVRVSIGANQEKIPTSEILYITCGPFACSDAAAEKPQAPEISAESTNICANWDPDLTLQVGMIDNDIYDMRGRFENRTIHDLGANPSNPDIWAEDDGIDLGWVSTSSVDMTVKHVFSNYNFMGPDAKKGTNKPFTVDSANRTTYAPAIQVDKIKEPVTPATPVLEKVGNLKDACAVDVDYSSSRSGVQKPDQCFRVRVGGTESLVRGPGRARTTNHLDGYSVEVSPKDSNSMLWGKVTWKEGPLKDLKCESMSFAAADQVDVCELLEDEVDAALAKGWGDVRINVKRRIAANSNSDSENNRGSIVEGADGGFVLATWQVGPKGGRPKPKRFKRLWFDDNLDGSVADGPNTLLQSEARGSSIAEGNAGAAFKHPTADDGEEESLDYFKDGLVVMGNSNELGYFDAAPGTTSARDSIPSRGTILARVIHDLYGFVNRGDASPHEISGINASDHEYFHNRNIDFIWGTLTDGGMMPIYGDFGKVDLYGKDLAKPDGVADNYPAGSSTCSKGDNGDAGNEACDAEFEKDFEVLFSDLIFGCEATRTVTLSCEWDAQGLLNNLPPASETGNDNRVKGKLGVADIAGRANVDNFAKCTVE